MQPFTGGGGSSSSSNLMVRSNSSSSLRLPTWSDYEPDDSDERLIEEDTAAEREKRVNALKSLSKRWMDNTRRNAFYVWKHRSELGRAALAAMNGVPHLLAHQAVKRVVGDAIEDYRGKRVRAPQPNMNWYEMAKRQPPIRPWTQGKFKPKKPDTWLKDYLKAFCVC
ncbi:hypothetical protein [Dromedary stool-associated circular ssDNA virus]|uniref:hypothetical protein n=1 Tax=Dromedary stool-associated circular ssDNA virus TaxID=1574422 RepID=UPI000540CD07|nr:hypothetical protein [Dromedary stool-associated circular ssDNA virus]AIY31230.1 hypothetical protein [Dromedary stool-associated circular ssDNA virus]